MKNAFTLFFVGLATSLLSAANHPQAEISNRHIRVKIYLPDARNGYYQGTRFDWSGIISSLEYGGHQYYGPWFDRTDPQVIDFVHSNAQIVAGPSSSATGPAEEFQTRGSALGWDEAKVGETFIKIGVGVLRKDSEKYAFAKLYEIVDPGQWTVKTNRESIQFTHVLADAATGYAYQYEKLVKLVENKLVLDHCLKNTGKRVIQSTVYNHNFLTLDQLPPGPNFTITVPYSIQTSRPPNQALAEIRGNQIVYLKTLENREAVQTAVLGFGDTPKDYEIRIENRQAGAGLKITGNRPLFHQALWSIRTVLSMEPFIAMSIDPGREFTWSITNKYYTLPEDGK